MVLLLPYKPKPTSMGRQPSVVFQHVAMLLDQQLVSSQKSR